MRDLSVFTSAFISKSPEMSLQYSGMLGKLAHCVTRSVNLCQVEDRNVQHTPQTPAYPPPLRPRPQSRRLPFNNSRSIWRIFKF